MAKKRLYRSRKSKKLGGVCGGIADYLNVDPVLIRLIWILWLFIGSFGLWVYILAWIIIKKEPANKIYEPNRDGEKETVSEKVIKKVLLTLTILIISISAFSKGEGELTNKPRNPVVVESPNYTEKVIIPTLILRPETPAEATFEEN